MPDFYAYRSDSHTEVMSTLWKTHRRSFPPKERHYTRDYLHAKTKEELRVIVRYNAKHESWVVRINKKEVINKTDGKPYRTKSEMEAMDAADHVARKRLENQAKGINDA